MSRALRVALMLLAGAVVPAVVHLPAAPPPAGREHPAALSDGPGGSAPSSSGVLDCVASDPAVGRLERLVLQDRYVEAFNRAVAELGERAHRLGPFAPPTLASLQWAAEIVSRGGDRRTAGDLFEGLLSIRRRTLRPDDPVLAETLLRRGKVARLQADAALAARFYTEARGILEAGSGQDSLLAALEEAEASRQFRTDLEAAVKGYKRALEIRRRVGPATSPLLADTLAWLGWALDRLQRPQEARPYVLEARRQLESLGLLGGSLDATLLQLLASQAAVEGHWEEAETLYRAAATANMAVRTRYLGGFARRVCPLDGYEGQALAALRRGKGDEAWVLLEKARAATHRDFAALGLWRSREPATFPRAQALRTEILEVTRRLDLARRVRGAGAWEADTWPLTLRALELRGRLSTLEGRYLEGPGRWEPSLEKTRALLGPRTALVGALEVYAGGDPGFVSQPRRSWGYLYVLRRTGPVRWIPLWDGLFPAQGIARADWGSVFERVNRAAEWPLRVENDPMVLDQLRTWTRNYFDPALPYLEGVDRLVVEPMSVTSVVEAYRDSEERYLLDRFEVSYAPSAAVLTLLEERLSRGRPRAPRAVLSIAASPSNGDHGDILAQAMQADRRDLRLVRTSSTLGGLPRESLPRLSFAGIEAEAVARRFREPTVLQGGADAEHDLRMLAADGRLRRYDVIHVAAHTLTDKAPERCGLILADGPSPPSSEDDGVLDAEEILLGWELGGPLMTLSACGSSRAGGFYRAEELGFTQALFAAGARNVLVSQWGADDRATAVLMDRFYQDLTGEYSDRRSGRAGQPLPPATALREAKIYLRDLVDDTGHRPFAHPVYWAGFKLIGLPDTP